MERKPTKRPSMQGVVLAEYRLLNALIRNKDYRNDSRVTESLLVDEVAKSVYEAIQSLIDRNIEITPASLLQAGGEIDYNVNAQVVQTVFDIEKGEVNSLDDILSTLKTAQTKDFLLEKIDILKSKLNEPGAIDQDSVLNTLYQMDDTIVNADRDRSKLLDFDSWSDKYIEDVEERKRGRKYSFGDPLLDEALVRGATPATITIVASSTSMGKSTFVLSLMDGLLENNTPCMYISLEMGTIDTFDRLISRRCGIDSQDLYKPENADGIIEMVQREKDTLQGRKNFFFCEASNIDINKLRSLIREVKQRTHQDYCFVAIDLLSGMKDFMAGVSGASTAATIEVNMNKLEALAKEENVHILGVVQIRRDADSAHITDISDIDKLRPTLGDIKNSGSFAEKATQLITLFRPMYYAEKYLPEEVAANMNDVMEVQLLKDRSAQPGRILKYMFDGPHFKVYPLVDEEALKMEQLKNLDLDY